MPDCGGGGGGMDKNMGGGSSQDADVRKGGRCPAAGLHALRLEVCAVLSVPPARLPSTQPAAPLPLLPLPAVRLRSHSRLPAPARASPPAATRCGAAGAGRPSGWCRGGTQQTPCVCGGGRMVVGVIEGECSKGPRQVFSLGRGCQTTGGSRFKSPQHTGLLRPALTSHVGRVLNGVKASLHICALCAAVSEPGGCVCASALPAAVCLSHLLSSKLSLSWPLPHTLARCTCSQPRPSGPSGRP